MEHAERNSTERAWQSDSSPSLIHLFSPPIPAPRLDPAISADTRRALWSVDSVHRANNLAQLAVALARRRPRSVDCPPSPQLAESGIALADAYAKLGDEGADATVPCAELLTRIVSGLFTLFGEGAGAIGLRCAIDPIALSPLRRRALILIASELVVNALKYAFPFEAGTISVSLSAAGDVAELAVEDDGVGLGLAARPGNGSRILDELAVLLSAPVERTAAANGGLRVCVRLPLAGQS